ncbi:hypothetical protein [Klebsiella variicola]|uniref:hypothetical protein n=1 Tax=Klebsiella variicola TaxID=244366 RepID=UPI00143302C4|nr:hypothetical protein [Klebsiella variicola]MCH6140090.1 hypothetical protein [Klebsiella variicola]MCH6175192.1 hypothetical protein [Klebsiella variicola]
MTKSTITRERLEQLADNNTICKVSWDERIELAQIALAAMNGEPVAWGNGCDKTVPAALRYLAENERPFGGESRFNAAHLYQLAREIELMAEAPLYRHAQPAPIVQCPYPCGWDALNKLAIQDAAFVALALVAGEPATESIRQAAITNSDRLLKVISACRAAMLQAQSDDDGEPTDDERIMAIEGIHSCERCGDEGWVVGEMGITRCACGQAGNCRENANSSTNNCREIPETSTNLSREHFISLCNEFWNWSEMDEVCAEDRGYELRMEWDGKVFKHPVTQALWRMYQAAPQEVNHG